eukprot:CAMPEP_0171081312 /NCGR_PEP_ID=MMETSP0766_2-20121228/16418_1 /TAXON_ID=439317 /ORGANISM="Gambierdiscus australes, Strain CAWD 149" /LENGTH=253 /DNA_ID=CAMNT_0011538607 /DNA_START=137 /DNA_END=896 /DNA_ORIENTATION=+
MRTRAHGHAKCAAFPRLKSGLAGAQVRQRTRVFERHEETSVSWCAALTWWALAISTSAGAHKQQVAQAQNSHPCLKPDLEGMQACTNHAALARRVFLSGPCVLAVGYPSGSLGPQVDMRNSCACVGLLVTCDPAHTRMDKRSQVLQVLAVYTHVRRMLPTRFQQTLLRRTLIAAHKTFAIVLGLPLKTPRPQDTLQLPVIERASNAGDRGDHSTSQLPASCSPKQERRENSHVLRAVAHLKLRGSAEAADGNG